MITRDFEHEYVDFDSKGNPEYSIHVAYRSMNKDIYFDLHVDTMHSAWFLLINGKKVIDKECESRPQTEIESLFALAWYERSIKMHMAKNNTLAGW